ncbi:MAG: hypothetical protein AUH85_04025 [Chloroflexi bacterium 13_1_40CM_4_68_4]|nr:MAG: hypothetical protein AUH85_04025 [Chloroflexi bacterium 13_1_40CM_4_68_4]
MTYKLVEPPFILDFRNMSRNKLLEYRRWFLAIMPERLNQLSDEVCATPGFESWQTDYSPRSLDLLGEWFVRQVTTRPRTTEELEEFRRQSPFPIDVSDQELTNRTFSLTIDVGMYFAQVLLRNVPTIHWDQRLKDKRYIDYGQPVLVGSGPVPLNPVHIMVMLAYGVTRKNQTGRRLSELYGIWSQMLVA